MFFNALLNILYAVYAQQAVLVVSVDMMIGIMRRSILGKLVRCLHKKLVITNAGFPIFELRICLRFRKKVKSVLPEKIALLAAMVPRTQYMQVLVVFLVICTIFFRRGWRCAGF